MISAASRRASTFRPATALFSCVTGDATQSTRAGTCSKSVVMILTSIRAWSERGPAGWPALAAEKRFCPKTETWKGVRSTTPWKPGGERAAAVFDSDSDIVDYQTALIEYESGENLCFHANLNVADHFRRFCVVGTKATAEGDFERNFLRINSALTSECIAKESYEFWPPVWSLWCRRDDGTGCIAAHARTRDSYRFPFLMPLNPD